MVNGSSRLPKSIRGAYGARLAYGGAATDPAYGGIRRRHFAYGASAALRFASLASSASFAASLRLRDPAILGE